MKLDSGGMLRDVSSWLFLLQMCWHVYTHAVQVRVMPTHTIDCR